MSAPVVNGRATSLETRRRAPAHSCRAVDAPAKTDRVRLRARRSRRRGRASSASTTRPTARDYLYTLLVPVRREPALSLLRPAGPQGARHAHARRRRAAGRRSANGPADSAATRRRAAPRRPHRFRRDGSDQHLSGRLRGRPVGSVDSSDRRPRRSRCTCARSRATEAEADTLIAAQRPRASRGSRRTSARRIPFQKFDFLLAPAFPFGGMEHPGAMFYNEESFIYREPPTLTQRLGREATIYHEVAHQWFGDFVTMRWFDDLWLKEGFATYMAAKMQADLEPGAERVEDVLPAQQARGLRRRRDRRHDAGVAAARQSRPGEEQLRRDRLQQGAGHPQAAQLPRRRHGVPRGLRVVPRRARVRQRDVAGSARRRSARAAGIARPRRRGDATTSCGPACRSSSSARCRDGNILAARAHPAPRAGALRCRAVADPYPAYCIVRFQRRRRASRRCCSTARLPTVRAVAGPAARVRLRQRQRQRVRPRPARCASASRWLEQHVGASRRSLPARDAVGRAVGSGARRAARAGRASRASRCASCRTNVTSRSRRHRRAARARRRQRTSCNAREAELLARDRARARSPALRTRRAPYGVRKAQLDAFIGLAKSPGVLARLDAALDSATVVGLPLRAPTRWAIVTHLVAA